MDGATEQGSITAISPPSPHQGLSPEMEKLDAEWQSLRHRVTKTGCLDTRSLVRSMRSFIERLSADISGEAVVDWCRSVFESALPLEEVFLFAWQILFLAAPEAAKAYPVRGDECVWMRLGRLRAHLIYGGAGDALVGEGISWLGQIITKGGVDALLSATVVEVAEKIIASEHSLSRADALNIVILIEEILCSKDELVLHKARALITSALVADRPVLLEVRPKLHKAINSIDKDVKMRYLLLKDLLTADIKVPGMTDVQSLDPLLLVMLGSKALAPSVADCIVLLAKLKGIALNLDQPDEYDSCGIFLFPRLVKRHPEETVKLLERLEASWEEGEDKLLQYFSLYLAAAGGENLKAPQLKTRMVDKALGAHSEMLRSRAFSCLCRSISIDSVFDGDLERQVVTHLEDVQLGSTSDNRQQIIAALKHLVDVHCSRLYKLVRDCIKIDPQLSEVEAEQFLSERKDQVSLITAFWRRVVKLCIDSMAIAGFYNKNDLCLKVLGCIATIWTAKLAKYSSVPPVHAELVQIFHVLCAPLKKGEFLHRLCDTILDNSFDAVREGAASLLKTLQYPPETPFIADQDYLETFIIPEIVGRRRADALDGISRLLGLYCDEAKNHLFVAERLLERLDKECAALEGAADIDCLGASSPLNTLASSSALGLISSLRVLMRKITPLMALRVIAVCRRIGVIATKFVSHPSPEGVQLRLDNRDDGEEDDCDDYSQEQGLSFSVMTFCWRAVKESSSLLAASLCHVVNDLERDFLFDCGKYLVDALLTVRHPGAFMSLARPLSDICQACFEQVQNASVPDELLCYSLEMCIKQPEVQTTRRSAGLPVCISAIVTACKDRYKRQAMLSLAIEGLLGSTLCDQVFSTSYPGPQLAIEGLLGSTLCDQVFSTSYPGPQVVHTLNILRTIFRDSSLAEDVISYLPTAFRLCFLAFKSPAWSVRNSGMMLFTALMNRTFGIRHDTDEFAACNLVDIRTIGAKCPTVLPLILQQCQSCQEMLKDVQSRGGDRYLLEFSVYPLLSCIQRIRFSAGGERRHAEAFKQMANFVLQCLGNDIMKVRKMASRLLVHMSESSAVCSLVMERIGGVLRNSLWVNHNHLHGCLLCLRLLCDSNRVAETEWSSIAGLETILAVRCSPVEQLVNGEVAVGLTLVDFRVGDIHAAIDLVQRRRLSAEEAPLAVRKLIEHIHCHGDGPSCEGILKIFEGFWTDPYDLSGIYRKSLVDEWTSLEGRAGRRLEYLALTDDDEYVRQVASGKTFGEPKSVPRALRLLLERHYDDIADLIDYLPLGEADDFDEYRKVLFQPEPLNSFKDPQWEKARISCN